MRVLIYNSSARGSGQYVRSLKLAGIITDSIIDSYCLILAGNSIVEKALPARTEVRRLPPIHKSLIGDFVISAPANGLAKQASDLRHVFADRKRIINDTIKAFDPNIFLVDSRPSGLNAELTDGLRRLSLSQKCKTVLMLRDIVDDPALVRKRWAHEGAYEMIDGLYNDVIIFGTQWVCDAIEAYQLSRFKTKVSFLGLLGDPCIDAFESKTSQTDAALRRILVTVGGGFDGDRIVDVACECALRAGDEQRSLEFDIVLGSNSHLRAQDLTARYVGLTRNTRIIEHTPDLGALMQDASLAISMCGYNTTCELVQRKKKIIAIPRAHSGREQVIRAELLSKTYDGIWVLRESELTMAALATLIDTVLAAPAPQVCLEMSGASNLVAFLLTPP